MHKIKKSYLLAINILIIGFFLLLVWALLETELLDGRFRSRFIGVSLGIIIFCVTADYKNRSRKYVKFNDKHVRINAYHKKTITKVQNIDILYEDIRALKVKKIPVFGVTALLIDADNYGNNIKIIRAYKSFTDMCETFYLKTKAFAPDAKISSDYIDYLKRKNKL